jgi:CRISPR-associated protein (TIGR03986 family)
MSFYNPYHWVPTAPVSAAQKAAARGSQATHSHYVPNSHSGRLLISITTVSHVVVGASRLERAGEFTRVEPYCADGEYAIPGSTVRGAIGSVIEVASNSPLRILNKGVLSYRKPMTKSLSAVGILVDDAGTLKLKPLALPTLPESRNGNGFEAPPRFRKIFDARPLLKVYVGRNHNDIASPGFRERTAQSASEISSNKVEKLTWAGNLVLDNDSLHKTVVNGARFLVAQEDATNGAIPQAGLMRVLGCWGKDRSDIPSTKKHELWLPWDDDTKPIPILPEAIQRFHALADERTDADATLPYHPLETKRNSNRDEFGDKIRLKEHDIVYFDIDEDGNVNELSFSSIWRAHVEFRRTSKAANVHDFFPPSHLPLNPQRADVSVAERMLGYVEEELPENSERAARALASRLRFADAIVSRSGDDVLQANWQPLRILSSPKPPSPALYFRRSNGTGAFIRKAELRPEEHMAHGRKWYLHSKAETGAAPWAVPEADLENAERKKQLLKQTSAVRPILPGRVFYGHVDVDNLSELELGLLLHAIEPAPGFHHKIGMGKPLGLGSVKIEVLGWVPVDRQIRYSAAGLKAGRYAPATLTAAGRQLANSPQWPDRYREELPRAVRKEAGVDVIAGALGVFRGSGIVPRDVERALELLGDYSGAPSADEVHYPTVADQPAAATSEHFRWFVANEKQGTQFLKPLTGNTKGIEPLDS